MTDAQNRFAVSLDDLKREIQQLQVKQNEFQADLSEVKTSVRKIATDLSGVKTSVGKLETDLSEVKHNVKALIHDTAINKNRTDCLVEVPFPQTHEMPWGMQVETGRNRSRELSELTSEKVIRQLDNVEAKAYFTRYYPGETVPRDQGEIHDAILRAVGGPTL
ncbi:hypothetical protein EW026_g4089 [Hermanssonia centrifuga]|uniref:Mug135-like C-terminal domain-containing protein n=1 Tax=Hermanssonia centrifuga TaxID=98765 RepID=A0A4S4KJ92_9APHY|nr:hypothetical protein EW026_g4089 [Hermanssonia centrifuga]